MNIIISNSSMEPIYEQIIRQIKIMIMEKKLDKRNFRKKVITTEGLRELNEFSKSSSKRPARLYTFDSIKLNSKRAHFIRGGSR